MTGLRLSFLGLILICVSCGKKPDSPPPTIETKPEMGSSTETLPVLRYADHAARNKNRRKKYFLVAGGHNNANFAQEIIDQKKWLLGLGVKEEDITCFYTRPFDKGFAEDERQYRTIADELSRCYPANPGFVWEQLADGGQEDDFVYLYVSSHGALPLRVYLSKRPHMDPSRPTIESWLTAFPELNQFNISLDALTDGNPVNFAGKVELLKSGQALANQILFTPAYLKQALKATTTPKSRKFVVLQACYSGGFGDADSAQFKADSLTDIPGLTLMTAARHDRSSFGCQSGNIRTDFGGAYTDSLRTHNQLPTDLDWATLYTEVKTQVSNLESEYKKKLNWAQQLSFRPSEPQFFKSK